MKAAKAAILHELNEPLVVEDIELWSLGPHHVRVRVGACGVCHTDRNVARGMYGMPRPFVIGHEGAGTVLETEEIMDGLPVSLSTTRRTSCVARSTCSTNSAESPIRGVLRPVLTESADFLRVKCVVYLFGSVCASGG